MAAQVMPAPVARQAAKVANFGYALVGTGALGYTRLSSVEYISISFVRHPVDPHARIAKTIYSEKELTSLASRHTMGCKMNQS